MVFPMEFSVTWKGCHICGVAFYYPPSLFLCWSYICPMQCIWLSFSIFFLFRLYCRANYYSSCILLFIYATPCFILCYSVLLMLSFNMCSFSPCKYILTFGFCYAWTNEKHDSDFVLKKQNNKIGIKSPPNWQLYVNVNAKAIVIFCVSG